MHYLDESNERYIPCTVCGNSFLSYCEELHTKCDTCEPPTTHEYKDTGTCPDCHLINDCECLPF